MTHASESHDVTANGLCLRISSMVVTTPLLVGGPLEVESRAELVDGQSLHLALSSDRARGRPAGVSFSLDVDELTTALSDPVSDVVAMGGGVTSVEIQPEAPAVSLYLVNEFLTLERLLDFVEMGDRVGGKLESVREIAIAPDAKAAVFSPLVRDSVRTAVRVQLRRDDEQLLAGFERAAREVLGTDGSPLDRERSLSRLVNMRHALVIPLLEKVARATSDQHVRERARWGIEQARRAAGAPDGR